MHVKYLGQLTSNPALALSSSSSISSVKLNFCNICYDPGHFAWRCSLLANPHFAHLATVRSGNMQKPSTNHRPKNPNKPRRDQNKIPRSRTSRFLLLRTIDTHLTNKAKLRLGPENPEDKGFQASVFDKVAHPTRARLAQLTLLTARGIVSPTSLGPTADKLDFFRTCALLSQPHD